MSDDAAPTPGPHGGARPHARANRLIREASPYLLQHAHNPVDWWPWGEAAFAEARRRDVPIFLSIGYSTCYWCHVMERESFEDAGIAALMNERFVCVKVDREQRPDVDDLYMAATQIMTGHGGWPMSVFLEPAGLRPFWCGTYFPPRARPGLGSMPTFPQVLEGISSAWREQRDEVLRQGEALARAVREHLAPGESGAETVRDGNSDAGPGAGAPTTTHGTSDSPALGIEVVQEGVGALLRMFDRTHGGFGGAPKFPQTVYLDLLLDVRERAGDDATRTVLDQTIRHTLDRMAVGGIRDQAGGGFHRYSVDAHWTVPHFEKMLYDNAMLAEVYARAGAMYGSPFYREVARTTIGYVLREMTRRDDAGRPVAFLTAQDAEVDHREGLNYLWTPEEVRAALDPSLAVVRALGVEAGDADLAIRVYGLDRGANFRDPHHPDEPARHVLRMDLPPEDMAARVGVEPDVLASRLARINGALYDARMRRKQPHLDDKAVLSWNGLMVRALAVWTMCDQRGETEREFAVALDVASSLLRSMTGEDGALLRVWRGERAQTLAVLEDYAAMVRALVTLGRAAGQTADADWAVVEARRLITEAERLFGDGQGGFFDTRAGATDLFVRTRATYDGAMPAGATLMALALAELAMWTRESGDLDRAVGAIRAIGRAVRENPVGSAVGTRALLTLLREPGLTAGRLGYDASGRGVGSGREGGPGVGAAGGTTAGSDPAASGRSPFVDGFTPVEVFAPDERIVVKLGEPAELRLMIRIAPGYHVVAADPGEAAAGLGLVAFRVDVIDVGASGSPRNVGVGAGGAGDPAFRAYADYPPGAHFRPSQAVAGMNVYQGEFELLVVLERVAAGGDGEVEGRRDPSEGDGRIASRGNAGRSEARPILVVTFQACTERECLRPQRLELDVAVD